MAGTWPGGFNDDETLAGEQLVNWRARRTSSYGERKSKFVEADPAFSHTWLGSFLDWQRGGTEQVYMRNRYYDPVSGRFTQEDPIGFAGGINLYAYAGSNPVGFRDPFGLCPVPPTDCPPGFFTNLGATTGLAAGTVVAASCTVGTGGVCGLGAPAIVAGFGALGAGAGATAEVLAQNADRIADRAERSITAVFRKAVEIVGMVIGLATNTPPPRKPDEPPPPPPPVQTGPGGSGEPPPLPPGVKIGP